MFYQESYHMLVELLKKIVKSTEIISNHLFFMMDIANDN